MTKSTCSWSAAELLKQAEDDEVGLAERLGAMGALGWASAPRSKEEEPLVWIHSDGAWGLSMKNMKTTPNEYWMDDDRIDTIEKLIGWLSHLSGKRWFKRQHVRQMIALFYKLHPESDVRPI